VEIELSPYKLCHKPVITYCIVYHYTKRAMLARLLANEGPCHEHAEQEQSDLEWSGVTLEWKRVDNKSGNNLGLSSYTMPRSTVVYVVVYFRRTELLPGVQERSGI